MHALKLTSTVQPGGRVEVSSRDLPEGQAVDVIVLFSPALTNEQRSVMDVLAEAPGHLTFQTAEQVEAYIREERDAWDR